MSAALAALLLLLAAAPAPADSSAPGAASWTWRSRAAVEFVRPTGLGTVLAAGEDGLRALDASSGAVRWSRADLARLHEADLEALPGTPWALVHLGEGAGGPPRRAELIDLASGERRWDTRALPLDGVVGAWPVPGRDLLVMLGPASDGGGTVAVAVQLSTGALLWQQRGLFARPLALRRVTDRTGHTSRPLLAAGMPALFDDAGHAFLWVSQDGPMALDLATGRRLWSSDVEGPVPSRLDGCADWMLAGHTIYAPSGRTLVALEATSGLPRWRSDPPFASVVGRMQLAPLGLVVQGWRVRTGEQSFAGAPFLDVLDPATGGSRWLHGPTGLDAPSPFALAGDTLYLADGQRLLAVAPDGGPPRTVAALPLERHDPVGALGVDGGDLVLATSHALLRLSTAGTTRFAASFPAPVGDGWRRVAEALVPPSPAEPRGDGAAPDSARAWQALLVREASGGRNQVAVVRVDRATGGTRRVKLDEPESTCAIDDAGARLFYVRDGHEVVSVAF